MLYDRVLRVDPSAPKDEARDRFILSKGHGPSAYYAVLSAEGFFPEHWLPTFTRQGSRLGSHPDHLLVRASKPPPAPSATACPWPSALPSGCAPRVATRGSLS